MLKKGAELELRDLDKQRLTVSELDELIGHLDYKMFLNTRNELYRRLQMNEKPPARAEALRLMAANPNLIRRPLVIRGGQIILGYDEPSLKKLVAES